MLKIGKMWHCCNILKYYYNQHSIELLEIPIFRNFRNFSPSFICYIPSFNVMDIVSYYNTAVVVFDDDDDNDEVEDSYTYGNACIAASPTMLILISYSSI